MARRRKENQDDVVMGKRGIITLPLRIRRAINAQEGTRFRIVVENDYVKMMPLTRKYFESVAGILKGDTDLRKELLADHREEADR